MNKSNFSSNVEKFVILLQAVVGYKLSRIVVIYVSDKEKTILRFVRAVRIDVQIMNIDL